MISLSIKGAFVLTLQVFYKSHAMSMTFPLMFGALSTNGQSPSSPSIISASFTTARPSYHLNRLRKKPHQTDPSKLGFLHETYPALRSMSSPLGLSTAVTTVFRWAL